MEKDAPILFYKVNDPYGEFSNFSAHPIFVGGRWWPTSEHYFQAKKFVGTPSEEQLRTFGLDPMRVKTMGGDRKRPLRPDWESVKEEIMFEAILAKFSQHSAAREVLMNTGNRIIVEHTRNDRYWADGGDGSGKNRLGACLERLRAHFRAHPEAMTDPNVPDSPKLPVDWKTFGAPAALANSPTADGTSGRLSDLMLTEDGKAPKQHKPNRLQHLPSQPAKGHASSSAGPSASSSNSSSATTSASACTLDPRQAVAYSKKLSYLLRHGAKSEGLDISSDGYIRVADILRRPDFRGLTLAALRSIVDTNDKKRFTLRGSEEEGNLCICANQGHTMEITDLELTPINSVEDCPVAVHGTYFAAWNSIQKEGLSRMRRQHVHFAAGLPGSDGVISGMRSSAQVLVFLDVHKCLQAGIPLFRSANNVILSPGNEHGVIPPALFKAVQDARNKNSLL